MLCSSESDWCKLLKLHPIFCNPLFTLLHPVLASSFPQWQDFSKRASFLIVCVDWFYKKAVSGVVKSWEFEGNLKRSKILRIRRKNPMKWVLSISRDYWVYLDITLQSFKIWEFRGEFWGIETFYRSKFSPATGVTERYRKWISWYLDVSPSWCRHFQCLGFLTGAPTTNLAWKRVKTRYLTLFRATKNCVVICRASLLYEMGPFNL